MDKKEIGALLKQLSAIYPTQFEFPTGNESDDKAMVDTWNGKLGRFKKNTVLKAVDRLGTRSPRYPPNLYQIVSEAEEIRREWVDEKRQRLQRKISALQESAINDNLTDEEAKRLNELQRELEGLDDPENIQVGDSLEKVTGGEQWKRKSEKN